jgi:hypothetical protein
VDKKLLGNSDEGFFAGDKTQVSMVGPAELDNLLPLHHHLSHPPHPLQTCNWNYFFQSGK